MQDLALDLRNIEFYNIQDLVDQIQLSPLYKDRKNNGLKFLIVDTLQRYMILMEADSRDIDNVTERFLGLQISVSK